MAGVLHAPSHIRLFRHDELQTEYQCPAVRMVQFMEPAHALFMLPFHAGADRHLLLLSVAAGAYPPQLEQLPDRACSHFHPLSRQTDTGGSRNHPRKFMDIFAVLCLR